MKMHILKAITLVAILVNFNGCSSKNDEGLNIPSSSVYEKNSNTKIYYEDNIDSSIKNDLDKISKYINSNDLIPGFVITNKPSNSSSYSKYISDLKTSNNTENKKYNFNTTVDKNRNIIIVNKQYSSKDEIYSDYLTIIWSFYKLFTENSSLQDEYQTSSFLVLEESLINENILAFTTKKEVVRRTVLNKPIKQLELGGYKVVNTPAEADKVIYFDLTRDYKKSELDKMKKEGKSINYSVASAGNNTQIMNSTMNLASHSNSTGTSIGAGIGAGLAFSVIDSIMSQNNDYSIVFPSMKIIDKKANKSYIQLFEMGFINEDSQEKGLTKIDKLELRSFIDRINNGMNRFTDSIMFQHIPLN